MKVAHSIKIKVLFDELEESKEDLINLLRVFFPEKINLILEQKSKDIKLLEKEKFEIKLEKFSEKNALKNNYKNLTLMNGSNLTMITLIEEKETLINEIIQILKEKLGQNQCEEIISQENRIDDECNFYIRLDKNILKNNKYILTDKGNCVHFKIKLACYPRKKENAIKIVKEIFQ